MRRRGRILVIPLILVLAVQVGIVGCSKNNPPTKAEFMKAVVDHALSTNCRIIMQSLVIIEQGKRKDDGSWPYKIRYSCMENPSGGGGISESGRTEREEALNFYKTTDGAGKPVWAVR